MPYYITKDTIENEMLNVFNCLNEYNSLEFKNSLNNFSFNFLDNEEIIDEIKNSDLNRNLIENFSDMLFQLKDYKYYLKVILTLFLKSNKYSEVAYLINRTFVNHIGDVFYVSGKNYDYSERYFDRFIESVKYTEIDYQLVLDFIFHINTTMADDVCYRYLRPSKEYLKSFIVDNETNYFDYISKNEQRYLMGLKLYVEFFTDKGLNLILEKYVSYNIIYEDVVEELIKDYKHNSLPILERILTNSNLEQKLKALNLLKIFKNDVQVNNFIEKFYNKIDDENIKREIKTYFLNQSNLEFNTVEDYKKFTSTKNVGIIDINLPNEYPLYFSNGEKVDEVTLSYIFDVLKNNDNAYEIKEMDYLKKLIDLSSAYIVSKKLFDEFIFSKIITKNSLFAVRFIVLFGDEYLNNEIITIIKSNMIDSESLNKVLELYAEFNNNQILKIVKENYKNDSNKNAYNILKIYARLNKISVEDYIDSLVDTFDLTDDAKRDIYFNGNYLVLSINDNLNVELIDYASKNDYYISKDMADNNENYYLYIMKLKTEIKKQIQRFKDAFYNFRLWDINEFDNNILDNPLLNKIASTLTFGYYKGGKLISVLKKEEGKIVCDTMKYDDTYKIGLVHPVELDNNKEIISCVGFEPFNQLRRTSFRVGSNEYTLSRVSTFSGMLANYKYFVDYLKLQGWENGLEVLGNLKSLIKKYPNENLLCEITFEKIDNNTITINDIRFYNLSNTITQGSYFVINKNDSLLLSVISKRTYSNVLYEVSQACFN